jgi:diketogulonate reductase-like aldo/keto reductase
MLDHPVVVEIARKREKTPAQVLIRWSLQNGAVTIPKTTKRHRALENSQVS